jgi:Ni/Fe-hydrogenase subunit HybB-like protein
MTTYVQPHPLVAAPVRPRILTPGYAVLLSLAAMALVLIAWRFAAGLGAATALTDGYPWGIWIAFDVVVGTALACGGYAVAFMVYVLNEGKYHRLIRPAILTSALGYSLAGLAVMIDVGRPWLAWKLPIKIWTWNVNSVLLEVAVCIMAYVVVLWLELAPAFLEKFKDGGPSRLQRFAARTLPLANRSLFLIVGLGVILPTLHQSSLGSLMLLAGPRLHPLWNTAFLPFFYLLTAVAMGFAVVVMESAFSRSAFGHATDMKMLRNVGRFAAYGAAIFVALRFIDHGVQGRLGLLAELNLYTGMFWAETILYLVPLMILLRRKQSLGTMLRVSMLIVLAGALYRFNTFLVAFDPGPGWSYFPSVPEQLITIGLVAGEVAIYIAIVKNFPILSGGAHAEPAKAR